MRALVATVAVAVVAAAGMTVAATATATRDGLPAYTDGYAGWRKLNRKPVTAPGAHNGVKNVYGEVGTAFATCCVTNPRFAAAFIGTPMYM